MSDAFPIYKNTLENLEAQVMDSNGTKFLSVFFQLETHAPDSTPEDFKKYNWQAYSQLPGFLSTFIMNAAAFYEKEHDITINLDDMKASGKIDELSNPFMDAVSHICAPNSYIQMNNPPMLRELLRTDEMMALISAQAATGGMSAVVGEKLIAGEELGLFMGPSYSFYLVILCQPRADGKGNLDIQMKATFNDNLVIKGADGTLLHVGPYEKLAESFYKTTIVS
jgi:hypothetical protein